ncbi:hypothetical protein [Chlamydia pecorum]
MLPQAPDLLLSAPNFSLRLQKLVVRKALPPSALAVYYYRQNFPKH